MFAEEELLPLSGLQHFTFCERRWSLVHVEQIWEDNRFTAEGELLHERTHSGELESRPNVLVRRALPLHSLRLGLSGQADVVEFRLTPDETLGIRLHEKGGLWRSYPVEYKRKRAVGNLSAYKVQLCAQALCLEEMLGRPVPEGAIYDGTAHRRQPIAFTADLRAEVERAATRMHELFRAGKTPPPVLTKGCMGCSLLERCQPGVISQAGPVARYLATAIEGPVRGPA